MRSDAALPALVRGLLTTVLPAQCPVTGEIVSEPGTIAGEAWRDLGRIVTDARCRSCGREMPGAQPPAIGDPPLICEPCHRADHPWERGAAAMRYEGTGRALILALKHGDRLDLVPLLARWMYEAAPELVSEADLILPVPLHWHRLWTRRYNQSAELARKLARLGGKPGAYRPRLLRRARATPSQEGRDREARVANVADAFTLAPGSAQRLAGKRVLLIDDVLTTGATLGACAALCRDAGANVDILVSALVTPDPKAYLTLDPDGEEEPAHGTD
ncbi:MAG: ComF family protein [Pseudomonadota bacterium]